MPGMGGAVDWRGIVPDAVDEVGHALYPIVVARPASSKFVDCPASAWSKDMDGRIGIGRVARQSAVLAIHFACHVAAGLDAPRDVERGEKVAKVQIQVHGVLHF